MQATKIGTKGAASSGVRLSFRAENSKFKVVSAANVEAVFNTATDGSEDCEIQLKVNKAGTFTAPVAVNTTAAKFLLGVDVVVGLGGLATTATAGFLYLASCAGTPTGVPANTYTNCVPFVYDRTAHKIWVNDAGWKATAALS
jgi:hypothetical protein